MLLPILIVIVIIIIVYNSDTSKAKPQTPSPAPIKPKAKDAYPEFDYIKIYEKIKQQEALLKEEQSKQTIGDCDIKTPILKVETKLPIKNFKTNWEEYKSLIETNNIKTLYHFTDRANIESIKKYGALYSWDYCLSNNISIPMPGGDDLSRDLDKRYNLQNFVRISFTRNHPMMYIALDQQRIKNPVILEIDPEIIYWQNTKYANKNATRNDVSIGSEVENFKNIRFDVVKQTKHFDLDLNDKSYYQAEILILEKLPIEYIKNINRV